MARHQNTQLIQVGKADFVDGQAAVNVPVERTSTVRFVDSAAWQQANAARAAGAGVRTYGRHGGATHTALESALNELEGAERTFFCSSGLAAITTTFLALLRPGEHILIADNVYAPVHRLAQGILKKWGVSHAYFNGSAADLAAKITPETRLVYAESPGSLLYTVLDIPALAAVTRAHDLYLVLDNTWATGALMQPLSLGADVSLQALTKYVGGHSDLLLGAISAKAPQVIAALEHVQEDLGSVVGADDTYLALRGLRTLSARLPVHAKQALALANFLEGHALVEQVYYPALASHPDHALWRRDFVGANGLLSFSFTEQASEFVEVFIDRLSLFDIGASWGGYESLVLAVDSSRLDYQSAFDAQGAVVRLHVGLEHEQDLLEDVQQALLAVQAHLTNKFKELTV